MLVYSKKGTYVDVKQPHGDRELCAEALALRRVQSLEYDNLQ